MPSIAGAITTLGPAVRSTCEPKTCCAPAACCEVKACAPAACCAPKACAPAACCARRPALRPPAVLRPPAALRAAPASRRPAARSATAGFAPAVRAPASRRRCCAPAACCEVKACAPAACCAARSACAPASCEASTCCPKHCRIIGTPDMLCLDLRLRSDVLWSSGLRLRLRRFGSGRRPPLRLPRRLRLPRLRPRSRPRHWRLDGDQPREPFGDFERHPDGNPPYVSGPALLVSVIRVRESQAGPAPCRSGSFLRSSSRRAVRKRVVFGKKCGLGNLCSRRLPGSSSCQTSLFTPVSRGKGGSMFRMALSLGVAAVLLAVAGCTMCCHPYDYCGPVYDDCGCHSCSPCYRAGSVLSGSPEPTLSSGLARQHAARWGRRCGNAPDVRTPHRIGAVRRSIVAAPLPAGNTAPRAFLLFLHSYLVRYILCGSPTTV